MNRSIDNLTNAIYGKELSFKEFEFIVDDMKTTVFNSNQILDEEQWIIASKAFKNAYDRVFDPNQMRASAMIAQNAADNVADLATAARMIGDETDNSRQMELIFKKLNLLGTEMKAIEFIVRKAQEFKKLVLAGDVALRGVGAGCRGGAQEQRGISQAWGATGCSVVHHPAAVAE